MLHLPARFAVVIPAFPDTSFLGYCAVSTGKWSPTFRRILLPFSSVYYLTQRKRPEDLKLLTSNSTHFIIFYEMCRNSLLIQLCTCGSTVVSVPCLLSDTSNINVDSVIIEFNIPAVVFSLSRALI